MNICRSVSRCCRDGHSSHKKDSKWAWMVCLAASTNMAFTAGLLFCFGVLLPVFMDYFNESRERTGMKSIQLPFPFDLEIKKVIIKLQAFKRYPSLASLYIHNQTAFIIIRQLFIIFFYTLSIEARYIIVSKPSSSISPPLNPPPPLPPYWRKKNSGGTGVYPALCKALCKCTPTPLNHSLNKFRFFIHSNSKDIISVCHR